MEDLDKKYYRIGDVAEFIGVPESTIRYWEQEFTEVSPKRVSRNVRLYTPDDIQTLRIIHYLLKVRGLRIEAARTQMQVNRKNISRRLKVLDELTEVRDELTVMLKTLGKRKD